MSYPLFSIFVFKKYIIQLIYAFTNHTKAMHTAQLTEEVRFCVMGHLCAKTPVMLPSRAISGLERIHANTNSLQQCLTRLEV